MRRQVRVGLMFGIVALLAAAVRAGTRHLAVIVDTSGSMDTNDRPRYTMQLSQVLADLTDVNDELAVIRMPQGWFESCAAGASSSLVVRLDPSDRARFKRELDGAIQFNTGTWFAAPVRTAISILPRDPSSQRMLLFIADSGGLGSCEEALTQELLDLKRSGTTIAAINLGGPSGAFDRNPAFDFTTAALNAQSLVEAVALVYQRFLGAKRVQTGTVQGEIDVEISPYVEEAFLVVAADGPIGSIGEVGGNPGSAGIDLNYRDGGATRGLDGVTREYRIVRLERPAPRRGGFRANRVSGGAAGLVLQDSAVGVRVISSTTVPKGTDVALEAELFDQRTGQRITDTAKLPGLQTTLEAGGRTVTFHDDGQGGDRQAGDGIVTATTSFDTTGDIPASVHVESEFLDRKVLLTVKVIDAAWRLEIRTPPRTEVDKAVVLSIAIQPAGSAAALHPPEHIDVAMGGPVIPLRDDGQGADLHAGDRVYSASWTPADTGKFRIDYVPIGGSAAPPVAGIVEVVGRLRFGAAVPVQFGRLTREKTAVRELDLGSADVRGEFSLQVSTSFQRERSILEIDLGEGWTPLGREPRTLVLSEDGRRTWPLRLRVGQCPEGQPAGQNVELVIAGTGADGKPLRTTIPVKLEIVEDSWLHCWWPTLAFVAAVAAAGVLIHGFWSPSRFPPRLGVVLSPEEDMNEGFFHPIRGQRGSRSGFYRDARIYIASDFRLSSSAHNAIVRLRADRKQVRIEAVSGSAVWRQNADGAWEQIPVGESTARFGDLYRNDAATLYFELRNA